MATSRTERLLNLVIALAATRRWLTKEQIRAAVPQYADCGTDEAFDRMFERDKDDLRDLGVPLITGTHDATFDDEPGYRIDRDTYALPALDLTAQELAVLSLASQVFHQATLAGPAARALTKLRALGVEPAADTLAGLEPRVRATEPAFDPLYQAVRDRAPVRFRYRKPDGEVLTRRVEPWGLASRSGRWYVVGRDVERQAPRVFRLSRIEGSVRVGASGSFSVPDGIDPVSMVAARPRDPDTRTAELLVRPGRGSELRLRAGEPLGSSGSASVRPPEEWDRIHLEIGDVSALAEHLVGYGPDVVVVTPDDLRAHVVRLLTGARDVHLPPNPAGVSHGTPLSSLQEPPR